MCRPSGLRSFTAIAAEQGWLPATGALRVGKLPWPLLCLAGLVAPTFAALADMCYLWSTPHRLDNTRLRALIGEFANELLSCAWRHQITQDNRVLLETVTLQAIGGAMGPPSLDDLASFDFSDQGFDDPLGIAMSWEEKHGKKPPAAPATTDATTPDDEAKP